MKEIKIKRWTNPDIKENKNQVLKQYLIKTKNLKGNNAKIVLIFSEYEKEVLITIVKTQLIDEETMKDIPQTIKRIRKFKNLYLIEEVISFRIDSFKYILECFFDFLGFKTL